MQDPPTVGLLPVVVTWVSHRAFAQRVFYTHILLACVSETLTLFGVAYSNKNHRIEPGVTALIELILSVTGLVTMGAIADTFNPSAIKRSVRCKKITYVGCEYG